jgi:hypothetical protein
MRMIAAVALATLACGTTHAAAQSTGDLVGRWGVAAYWNESDAQRISQQARSFCNQPYTITAGRNGGAMMFEAFEGRQREFQVSGRSIVPVGDSNARLVKDIVSWNGQVLVFRYRDEEAGRKYGNMVFARCGGR